MTDDKDFSFERLEVYKKAISFINSVFSLCNKIPYKLQSSLGDQMRRASLSIANNIAEGSDKRFPKDKKRFYDHSLDSARECIPMFTVCLNQGIITSNIHDKLRDECIVICKMLRRLIQSVPE
ncbi:MAG: four helix bundle protein [Candidatus Omnitrophota bacterium]